MRDKLNELAKTLELDRWHAVEVGDGVTVRAMLKYDGDTRLEDADSFGSLHWLDGSGQRPRECDGAARKIQTRSGPCWWQPPKDVLSDAEQLAGLETRVRDYFLEHWYYVGVVVEVIGTPCPQCGERKPKCASLWGIESDAGAEYFAEVLNELVDEVQAVTP